MRGLHLVSPFPSVAVCQPRDKGYGAHISTSPSTSRARVRPKRLMLPLGAAVLGELHERDLFAPLQESLGIEEAIELEGLRD
jgi:hypothetical protein